MGRPVAHIEPRAAQTAAGPIYLAALVRRLGLDGYIKAHEGAFLVGANGKDIRVLSSETPKAGNPRMLNLKDVEAGGQLFQIPTPADIAIESAMTALGAKLGDALVFPPAQADKGPIDALVPSSEIRVATAHACRWTQAWVAVPQSRVWAVRLLVPDGFDKRHAVHRLQSAPGLMCCPEICPETASLTEYLTDLGWPYLAFPQTVVWHVVESSMGLTLWLATTWAALDALLVASLAALQTDPGNRVPLDTIFDAMVDG